jgi:2,3-bisphosphoglycerate-independent phosphoglycerate mutase
MILVRGFDKYEALPQFPEIFKLHPAAIATYPMYKGVARLVGMEILEGANSIADEIDLLEKNWKHYDFFYFHVKKTDSYGEDGNFDAKVAVIEEADELIPRIRDLAPDVIVVTGDHSTPCKMKAHSFHPVPTLVWGDLVRVDPVKQFNETAAICGGLGRIPATSLMPIALAHAGKLKKYGA